MKCYFIKAENVLEEEGLFAFLPCCSCCLAQLSKHSWTDNLRHIRHKEKQHMAQKAKGKMSKAFFLVKNHIFTNQLQQCVP